MGLFLRRAFEGKKIRHTQSKAEIGCRGTPLQSKIDTQTIAAASLYCNKNAMAGNARHGEWLVEVRRIELLSESLSPRTSTSVFCYCGRSRSLAQRQTDTPVCLVDCDTSQGYSHRQATFTTDRRPYQSRGTLRQDEC